MICETTIKICLVSCPGVRLQTHCKLYCVLNLFDRSGVTTQSQPKFPVLLYEQFCFEKRFNCKTRAQLLHLLSEETVVICLKLENGLVVSRYECDAKQFLFAKYHLRPNYSKSSRSLLIDSSNILPIAPKLEFSTNTSIRDN